MRVTIPMFNGRGAREAKMRLWRMSGAKNVANKRYSSWLDDFSGAAIYEMTFLSQGWTGRPIAEPQFPLWLWRKVAAIKPVWLSDKIIRAMKRISGLA